MLYTIRIFNVYKRRSSLNSLMTEISVLSFMNNTYIAYADNSQFNSKLDKVSTWTCWAKGSLLFKLWYRLETSISSLETLTSVCGSSVFRPFSLNASIIFQISTECTVNKVTISWLHDEDYYFDVLLYPWSIWGYILSKSILTLCTSLMRTWRWFSVICKGRCTGSKITRSVYHST